jgi:hypothetical protein
MLRRFVGHVSHRRALAGQVHVPFCNGFEGHQGTLATANRSYFLFCSAFFSSAATRPTAW